MSSLCCEVTAPRLAFHGLVVEVPPPTNLLAHDPDHGPGGRERRRDGPGQHATFRAAASGVPHRRGVVRPQGDHTSTQEQVSVIDVGIEQTRQLEWVITKLFVRKPGTGFRRRGRR